MTRVAQLLCAVAALSAVLAPTVSAIPYFHNVNGVDLQGHTCKLPDFPAQACPQLCVTSPTLCPADIRPACPTGQQWCHDGTCASSCDAALPSPCGCPASPPPLDASKANWFPCNGTSSVDVLAVKPADKPAKTLDVCAALLKSSQVNDMSYISCPAMTYATVTLELSIWKSFMGMLGIQICVIIMFAAIKYTLERSKRQAAAAASSESAQDLLANTNTNSNASEKALIDTFRHNSFLDTTALLASRRPTGKDAHAHTETTETEKPITAAIDSDDTGSEHSSSNMSDSSAETGFIRFAYYVSNPIGTIGYYISIAWIVYLQVFLGLTVWDYYASLEVVPITRFYYDYTQVPYAFVLVWHFMVLTLVLWRVGGAVTVRNFFRIRVNNVADADYVVVTRKVETVNATDHTERGVVRAMLNMVQAVEAFADRYFKLQLKVTCHTIQTSPHVKVPFFYYESLRYVYSPITRDFTPYPYTLGTTVTDHVVVAQEAHGKGGLAETDLQQRLDLVGPNEIDIPPKTFLSLWTTELSGWFYLYQGSCLWVWYYFSYWNMGLVLTIVILIASLIKTTVSYQSHRRIRMLASMRATVTVLRNGTFTVVDSREAAPGDVIRLTPGVLSVDLLLVQGEALLDESSLTGESRPIRKFPAPDSDSAVLDNAHHKRHILLAGTGVLQADEGAYGLVLKTNVATSRGVLIQKMLHPTPIRFVFDEQLKVVLSVMLIWGVICFSLVMYFMGPAQISSWFYSLFIISEVISPLLPAVLVAGQSVAADRLVRKHQVYCIDLPRITMAGKIQVFAFDKTGTLTKEGLDMWGFLPATAAAPKNPDALLDLSADYTALESHAQLALATAHSVTAHENQLLGNPVDVSMFGFTGCALDGDKVLSAQGDVQGTILKRWEFVHAKQTMSALVKDAGGQMHVFAKGSYEKIRDMCTAGVPEWYDATARGYAKRGGYVLAIASKPIAADMSVDAAIHQPRDDAESGLTLLGLVVFRNTLKPDTKDAIEDLQKGVVRTIMVSGDNVFTCVYIARECGLAPLYNESYARCVYADMEEVEVSAAATTTDVTAVAATATTTKRLVWRDLDTEEELSADDIEQLWEQRFIKPLDLASSGPAWHELTRSGLAEKYLLSFRIWGRMSPEQKIDVVRRHMAQNMIVGMCGDGGNDCGALNASHVGVALSEAEASIVAPFSSKTKSVRSCVDLIAQGRAALASSFAGFKFLVMYGMTMSSFCLVQYYFGVVLSQWTWIFIDGIIVVSSIASLTQAKALKHLEPRRPTAQLLGPQTMISIFALAAINWTYLFMGIYWLFQQDWFRCNEFDASASDASKWWLLGDNYESTMISAVVLFQFITNGAAFNFGDKFRRSWFTNRIYAVLFVALMSVASVLILTGPNWLTCMFRINCGSPDTLVALGYQRPSFAIEAYNALTGNNLLPTSFRWQLWAYVLSNSVASLLFERFVMLGPVRDWARAKWPLQRKYVPM
ncbi:hypothetical protein BC828DRAFT_409004 [Blastocladiella britannica]|nr:hypothetical protein BC828DRAFT_409004 [Blastocladiella britannica]